MKRLYFLVPDIENASQIVRALHDKGIINEGIHVIVKDQDKLEMTQIPEAGLFHTTDVLRALVKGAIVGGIAGLVSGLLILKFPPEEFSLGVGTVIGLSIFGVMFGAWASSLIGISIPNPVVAKFERAVEAGGIMMLVDIPNERENDILKFMQEQHPETTIHGLQIPPQKAA